MPNSPNSENENVWEVNTEYNVQPGNRGRVTAKPGQINYLNFIAATPKKQVMKNPYNQMGSIQLGYAGQNPKTPAKQSFKVSYGGKRKNKKTRSKHRTSRKTIRRRK